MNEAVTVFDDEKYTSNTEFGKSAFKYENVQMIAENAEYFVFIFDKNHAQVYAKGGLLNGTLDEFQSFIKQKTGKEIIKFGK